MIRILTVLFALSACSPSSSSDQPRKPAGTTADPVAVCERAADVCQLDGAKLGVCTAPTPGPAPEACAGRTPCFVCVSQH